jgi:hypothetical protein
VSEQGEIRGRLTLDSTQFRDEVLAARRQLGDLTDRRTDVRVGADIVSALADIRRIADRVDELASRSPEIRIDVNTGAAEARIAALEAQLASLRMQSNSTGAAAENASGNIALLVAGATMLVPALFPIAGVAAAGAGALGGLGAAALLAGTGVARGLESGSAAYAGWRPIVDGVIADVHKLQDTAATNILPGASATFTRLQALLPEVNRGIAEMASDIGRILPTGLDAVVTLIERGVPLWRMGADELGRAVAAVDRFAHSNGYADFIDYTIRNAPSVERFLTQVVQLVGDTVTAFAPWGEAILPAVTDVVAAFDWIVRTLGPALPVIAAGFTGWKVAALGIAAVSGAIDLVTGSLAGMTIAEALASGGLSLLVGAAAAGGAVALLAASGVKAPGGAAASRKGGAAAVTRPSTPMGGGDTSYNGFGAGSDTSATTAQAVALTTTVNVLNREITALQKVTAAQDKTSKSALTLEGSWDGAADAAKDATDAIKQNGTSLDRTTSKGRANREMILAAVQAAKQHADAINADGKHAGAAAVYTDQFALALGRSLAKMGMSKTAADQYIAKLLGIPKNKTTTAQLKTDRALARLQELQRQINAMHGKSVTITAKGAGAFSDSRESFTGVRGHAGGGTITGSGTASSDSVVRRLSVGEEVISNMRGQASAMRPLLKAINSGAVRSPRDVAAAFGTGGPQHVDNSRTVHLHVYGAPGQSTQEISAETMRRLNQELRGA